MSYEKQQANILQRLKTFSSDGFDGLALDIFYFQAQFNETYAKYLDLLKVDFQKVRHVDDIPFLPIQFFKNYSIKTGNWPEQTVFTSSGTSGESISKHLVYDLNFYKENTIHGFTPFYDHPSNYAIFALLPSYLERSGSSLIFMADHFIKQSKFPSSGFF